MTESRSDRKRIAILGGGPSGLFAYKRLIESGKSDLEINIFEKHHQLGAGMPYSTDGANVEHITNVSDNEIPSIVISIEEWVKIAPKAILDKFEITPANFNEYKVLPRLFFGEYLAAQFEMLQEMADDAGIITNLHLDSTVVDIIDEPAKNRVEVQILDGAVFRFDSVIVCTGHNFQKRYEGKVQGYFDSPYPPAKLILKLNHPVAIKGSSLTAIDAIRTLARSNGTFDKGENDKTVYRLAEGSENFKLVMHSRSGLLPAVRFHLEDSHLSHTGLLTEEELKKLKDANNGFLSLDYLFEKDFKETFRDHNPEFYERIKDLSIEEFVAMMMELRERLDPFQLLKAEYLEAEQSIKRKESVYWKEMLAVLSFAMNYPAKYLSAEDMLRLKQTLMPLISIVIAFIPQTSCRELLALYDANVIEIIGVGADGDVIPEPDGGATYSFTDENEIERNVYYRTFVDCIGQPHLSFDDFPFKKLLKQRAVSKARLQFISAAEAIAQISKGNKDVIPDQEGNYFLIVPGIAINDNYQIIDEYGAYNSRIYMMAVPYIGGFNPDYSGLDFCEAASAKIVKSLIS